MTATTSTPTRPCRGLVLAGVVLAVLVVGTAGPARADPPGPTNFSSRVVQMRPPVDGVAVEVLGGDAFLQLRNDGHEVVVPGYDDGEQYLRFDPDGAVWVNLRSNAYSLNDSRYLAGTATPNDVGPDQPPRWEQVSDDGTWAWHDHRIHWMSPSTLPPIVDPDLGTAQSAFEEPWELALVVDGESVVATGELTWLPDASPLPALAGLVVGAALVALVARVGVRTAIAVGVGTGVAITGVIGLAGTLGLPPGMQGETLPLVLTGIAAVVAVAGLAMFDRTVAAGAVAGAAGVPLLAWSVAQSGALTAPLVPPAVVPAAMIRIAVGLVAGLGLAVVVAGVRDLFTRPLA